MRTTKDTEPQKAAETPTERVVGSTALLAVDPLAIPESHAAFAKAVAALADAHGMSRFAMTYEPTWKGEPQPDRRIRGEMKIRYANIDRRGRPCRNLTIDCDASLSLEIESNPESFS